MTTNVAKGAGRPAAAARSAKHAQRTPLPPRAGSPGAEAIAERKAEIDGSKPMADHTVAELRKIATDLLVSGARSMKKGDLLNAILKAQQAAGRVRAEKSVEAAAAQIFEVAEKSDRIVEILENYFETADPAKDYAEPSTPPDAQTKSHEKAFAFLEAAAKLGWAECAQSAPEAEEFGVVVGRGDERITISWRNGVFVGEACYHSHPARAPRKVINASAAKKIMAVPAAQADEEARKVTAHKLTRPSRKSQAETTTERRAALPFDPETATDEEVLVAVANKRLSWANEISGAVHDAYVIGAPSIQPGRSGRSVRFTSATGFNSVRVSSIISIR